MKKEYPDILKLEGEKWHNPDPATGKLGTRVPAEWLQTTEDSLKSLTLEMLEVLKAAGINPNELNNTQVRDAIQGIVLEKAGAPSTITASTKNSVTESSHTHEIDKATTSRAGIVQLTNTIDASQDKAITPFAVNDLQKVLQESLRQVVPVGVVLPYSGILPPNEDWLLARGSFDVKQYPELAKFYPDGNLADVRGTHLRFWDDGRGLDPNRKFLSYQEDAMQQVTGRLGNLMRVQSENPNLDSGVFKSHSEGIDTPVGMGERARGSTFDLSLVARTASETRPKNTAFNAIIKAR